MRTVDRMGIHIEQCEGCRGIFLDRGELEQISGAEQRHYSPAAPPPAYRADSPAPYRGGGHSGGYRDSPHGYGGHGGYRDSPHGYGGHGKRKRRGFLEELFD